MERFFTLVFLPFLCCLSTGCITGNLKIGGLHSPEKMGSDSLNHVVLLWLKESGNLEHRKKIIYASKKFKEIPGVLEVRVGDVVESSRDIVDDSFDLGILVVVKNKDALKNYLDHRIHRKAKNEVLLPLVRKFKVYDFKDS